MEQIKKKKVTKRVKITLTCKHCKSEIKADAKWAKCEICKDVYCMECLPKTDALQCQGCKHLSCCYGEEDSFEVYAEGKAYCSECDPYREPNGAELLRDYGGADECFTQLLEDIWKKYPELVYKHFGEIIERAPCCVCKTDECATSVTRFHENEQRGVCCKCAKVEKMCVDCLNEEEN